MAVRPHQRLLVVEDVEAGAEHRLHAAAELDAVHHVRSDDDAARIAGRGEAGQDEDGRDGGLDGIGEADRRRQADVERESIAEPRQLDAREHLVGGADGAAGPRRLELRAEGGLPVVQHR